MVFPQPAESHRSNVQKYKGKSCNTWRRNRTIWHLCRSTPGRHICTLSFHHCVWPSNEESTGGWQRRGSGFHHNSQEITKTPPKYLDFADDIALLSAAIEQAQELLL
jgi:hypothetical protein